MKIEQWKKGNCVFNSFNRFHVLFMHFMIKNFYSFSNWFFNCDVFSFVNFFTAQPPFEINKFNLRNEMCVQMLWHTLMRKLKTVIDSNHTKPARKTFMIELKCDGKIWWKNRCKLFFLHPRLLIEFIISLLRALKLSYVCIICDSFFLVDFKF